ncbi:MAG: bifunctional phosphoglucose/phosphomannose isomerase [Acidimicrobiales bacterium]
MTIDSLGMFHAIASLPEQASAAVEAARNLEGLPDRGDIDNVVVLGMGGSAIAGDVLVSAAGPYMPVPVLVFRGYHVPAFVGERSLVFAISFSGGTEETLEAVTEAALSGASVVAITQGDELGRLARAWDAPVIEVPADIPQPRAALGALAIPPMIVLEDMGLFPGASHWIAAAVEQLRTRRSELLAPGNQAEALARSIGRTIPLVHGGGGVGSVAAHRWKTQMNENAKVPAFWNAQPEVCHNEIAGWGQHGDLTRQAITLVGLRHDYEHPQVMHRFELTYRMLSEVMAGVEEVAAQGEGELAQLLDLVLIGDFTSLYLAVQEGIDPGPIPAIDEMKAALATAAGEREKIGAVNP